MSRKNESRLVGGGQAAHKPASGWKARKDTTTEAPAPLNDVSQGAHYVIHNFPQLCLYFLSLDYKVRTTTLIGC